MGTERSLRSVRAVACAVLGLGLGLGFGCPGSGPSEQNTDMSTIAGSGGAPAFGTGGIGVVGAQGSGGMLGTGGSVAPGTGGSVGTGGATAQGSGGVSAPAGSGGMNAMNAGTGGSMSPVMDAGSGGSGALDAGPMQYNPCPDTGDPCKILPLGDSITFGIQFAGAYRVELFNQAVEAGQNITFVGSQKNGPMMVDGVAFPQNHEGYSGYTINQIDQMILTKALMFDPDIITLMIGTNDMYGQDPAGAPERLGGLLDHILDMSPDALLVVAKLTPLSCCMSTVETYNDAVGDLVAERAAKGKHILVVDMSDTMISSDSVHPNEAGYTHMGQVFYAAIADVLPKKP
jgi:lysophospholipase L1-like esterase